MGKCPICLSDNSDDSKFCRSCGIVISEQICCPKCGELNPNGTRFCGGCGQLLKQEAWNQFSGGGAQTIQLKRKSSGCLPAVVACIIFFVLLSVSLSAFDSYNSKKSEVAARSETTLSLEEKADTYPKGDYEDYARNPDTYSGFPVQIEGTVLQVVEGDESNAYRIYTDEDYNQIWYVEYAPVEGDSRILENDTVTIYGIYRGICTYESVLGGDISIPAIAAENMIVE